MVQYITTVVEKWYMKKEVVPQKEVVREKSRSGRRSGEVLQKVV